METPYRELFPEGTLVRVVGRSQLEEFRKTWLFHHPLTMEQLAYAGRLARVTDVGFYHGGDALYRLENTPGTWHERCLSSAGEQEE